MHQQSVLFDKVGLPGTSAQKNTVRNDFKVQRIAGQEMKSPPNLLRQDQTTGFVN